MRPGDTTPAARPLPPFPARNGMRWVVVEEDPRWRLLPEVDIVHRCRFGTGVVDGVRVTCRRPTVATLERGVLRRSRWHYCEDHLYGRWIDGNRIVGWRLRKVEP